MMRQNIAKHRCPGSGLRRVRINRRIGVDADFQEARKSQRFLQEGGALGQFHIRKDCGVTGHEEHFDFRLEFDDLVTEIGPVKAEEILIRKALASFASHPHLAHLLCVAEATLP
jgi:hypothetical protein